MKNKKTISILVFVLVFIVSLTAAYSLWYPVSFYYAWFRLKAAYILLNLFGIYPTFSISGIQSSQGEMFAFLPYISLMMATYKKEISKHLKEIGITFVAIVLIEILGRFLEKYAGMYPKNIILSMLAIFFLGTARVALPFLSWFISLYRERKPFSKLFSSEPE
ncbi:MAG: hypothetical protein PHI40_02045 [Caldisericia bacterium]|nr:hypothetical protein [Caldisericia bacterium]MDD4614175.1 hypothetical protein [Caldisericia bacterium]